MTYWKRFFQDIEVIDQLVLWMSLRTGEATDLGLVFCICSYCMTLLWRSILEFKMLEKSNLYLFCHYRCFKSSSNRSQLRLFRVCVERAFADQPPENLQLISFCTLQAYHDAICHGKTISELYLGNLVIQSWQKKHCEH